MAALKDLMQIGTQISTPLALGGLLAVIFFLVTRTILTSKGRLAPLSVRHSYLLQRRIVDWLLVLSTLAMVLGFIGYVINLRSQLPLSSSKSPENLSEKRRDIRKFLENHTIFDSPMSMETVVLQEQQSGALERATSLNYGSHNDKQFASAISDYMSQNLEAIIEREVPYDVIQEWLAFDATPEGNRMLQGYRKVFEHFVVQNTNASQSVAEADRRIVEGNATDDDLSKLIEPNIPSYMKELFVANTTLLAVVGNNADVGSVIGPNNVKALQRNMTITKNTVIEGLSKLIEEEFSLDEIRFQIQFYEEHPRLRELMAKFPQFMATATKNPDPIASEKLRRSLGKISDR